jgi:hypothetical protein
MWYTDHNTESFSSTIPPDDMSESIESMTSVIKYDEQISFVGRRHTMCITIPKNHIKRVVICNCLISATFASWSHMLYHLHLLPRHFYLAEKNAAGHFFKKQRLTQEHEHVVTWLIFRVEERQ